MPKAKKMGRPKLPKGHAKGFILPVRLTQSEVVLFKKRAKASDHKTLSEWVRHALREAADSSQEGGK